MPRGSRGKTCPADAIGAGVHAQVCTVDRGFSRKVENHGHAVRPRWQHEIPIGALPMEHADCLVRLTDRRPRIRSTGMPGQHRRGARASFCICAGSVPLRCCQPMARLQVALYYQLRKTSPPATNVARDVDAFSPPRLSDHRLGASMPRRSSRRATRTLRPRSGREAPGEGDATIPHPRRGSTP